MERIISILHSSLYHIDSDISDITKKQLSETDAQNYVGQIISDMVVIKNTRKCEFKVAAELVNDLQLISSNYNEVAATSNTGSILSVDEVSKNIAYKLLKSEMNAKKHEKNLKMTITKGSLLQAFTETLNGYCFILSKIEHEAYIDTEELRRRYGFPFKRITLKSCSIDMDYNFNIREIKVSDTGSSIAKYWIDGFLEVTPIVNNTDNTKNAYSAINKIFRKHLKQKSLIDYSVMQQKVNYYLSSNSDYKHSDMIEYLMDNFSPDESLDIDKEQMLVELNNIPERYSIDTHFTIDLKAIEHGLKQNVKVSDGINLSYEGDPKELRKKIKGVQEDGLKVLKILGVEKEVYDLFKE